MTSYQDRLPYPPASGNAELDQWLRLVWREVNYPLGNSRVTLKTVTSDHTVTVADNHIRLDTGGTNKTVYVGTASTLTGAEFTLKHVGSSGTIFVVGTVDGASNYSFSGNNTTVRLRSTGTAMEIQ
jgi:hypothetical protein